MVPLVHRVGHSQGTGEAAGRSGGGGGGVHPKEGEREGGVSLAMEKEGGCDGHERRGEREEGEGEGEEKADFASLLWREREQEARRRKRGKTENERTTRPPKKEERDAFEKSRRAEKSAGKKCGLKRESRAKLARRAEGRSGCNLNGASPRPLASSLAHSKHLCNNVHARCSASDRETGRHSHSSAPRSLARSPEILGKNTRCKCGIYCRVVSARPVAPAWPSRHL